MTCPTCNGYTLVEVEGQWEKQPCPDCTPAPKQTFSRERIQRIRQNTKPVANRAPVRFVRCPVHKRKIGLDGEGRLLGRCDGCAREYAEALRWLRDNPKVVAA